MKLARLFVAIFVPGIIFCSSSNAKQGAQSDRVQPDELMTRQLERKREGFIEIQKEKMRTIEESILCGKSAVSLQSLDKCDFDANEKLKNLRDLYRRVPKK